MRLVGLLLLLAGCAPNVEAEDLWPAWNGERVGFWSPDGEFVVADVSTGERSSVIIHDGHPRRWVFAGGGEEVIVEVDAMWLEAYDVETGEHRAVVAGGDCGSYFGLANEPSGDAVAYVSPVGADCYNPEQGGIFLYPSGTLAFASAGPIVEFSWAGAARMLAVVHQPEPDRWVFTRVDLVSGGTVDLYESREPLQFPRLSADGLAWAVAEGDMVRMQGWQEQVGDAVAEMVWHPTRDELVVLTGEGSTWVLHPKAIDTTFDTVHPDGSILAGWPADGSGEAILTGCGDGRVAMRTDDDGRECIADVQTATWSPHQHLLLLQTDEVLVADPDTGDLRSLGPGSAARWAP